jgi:NADPH:quinone reductase-like Zn-dependent oxidoreductase
VRRESAVAGVLETGGDVVLVDGPGLAKRVSAATGGAGIRLGIDAVGGQSTDHLAAALTDGGVLVNYGAMSGEPCQVSPASFVFRDITLRGFWLSKWFIGATPERRMAVFGEIAALIAAGVLKSRIQATYPIDRIRDAVGAAAAGERDGKILIVPNG